MYVNVHTYTYVGRRLLMPSTGLQVFARVDGCVHVCTSILLVCDRQKPPEPTYKTHTHTYTHTSARRERHTGWQRFVGSPNPTSLSQKICFRWPLFHKRPCNSGSPKLRIRGLFRKKCGQGIIWKRGIAFEGANSSTPTHDNFSI